MTDFISIFRLNSGEKKWIRALGIDRLTGTREFQKQFMCG